MLTISKPLKGKGRENYYLHSPDNYYVRDNERAGKWFGRATQYLGLPELVSEKAFKNLLRGLAPDGVHKLVQNADAKHRQQGWDLTFSVPKDVSIYWALSTRAKQQEIDACINAALTRTLVRIEHEVGITRRGKGGALKEEAALLFALFWHFVSRELDPQVHIHAVLLNVCVRRDGSTGSIHSIDFFRLKKVLGQFFRDELANELSKKLGLSLEPTKDGFNIRGIPDSLRRAFSKRRMAIEKFMDARGVSGALAAKDAALKTRKHKQKLSLDQLIERWKSVSRSHGWDISQIPIHGRPSNARDTHRPETEKREEARNIQPIAPSAGSPLPPPERIESGSKRAFHKASLSDGRQPGSAATSATRRRFWFEFRLMFPRGPKHKFMSGWTAPRLVFGKNRIPWRWGDILWSRNLILDDLRLQERRLFPKAPDWSPFKNWKLPVLVFGDPRMPEAWGEIEWKKHLILGEVRRQRRILFPNAPAKSPFARLSFPALRFGPRSNEAIRPEISKTR